MEEKTYRQRANQLLLQSRFHDLKALSGKMLKAQPDYADAWLHQGIGLVETGDRRGFENMKAALALDPENDYYLYTLARALTRADQHKEGLQYIALALKLDPENEKYICFTGEILTSDKQYRKAIPYFDEVLKIDPENADALMNKAYCLTQLGEKREAEKYIDEALAIDPEDDHLQYVAAAAYYDLQQYKKSRTILDGYLLLDPRDEWARYTHLMAHHTTFSGNLFRPAAIKVMEKVTLAAGALLLVFQLLAFWVPALSPAIPLSLTYLVYTLTLYMLVRGFLVLLLVLRLPPLPRSYLLKGKDPATVYLYIGLGACTLAFLAAVTTAAVLAHLVYFILLNVFLFSLMVVYHKKLSRQHQWFCIGYGIIFISSLVLFNYISPLQWIGTLIPFTALVLVACRTFFMSIAKYRLGFTKEEDTYSF